MLTCSSTTLTTRCLYWGWVGHQGGQWGDGGWRGIRGLHMKSEDGLLQSTPENSRQSTADNRTWAQVNGTQVSTTCGHQMPPPGALRGHMGVMGWGAHLTKHQPYPQADDMSCWPPVVWLLTTNACTVGGVGVGIKGANKGHTGEDIGGYIWKMKMVYCKVLLKIQDGLLQTIEHELRSMGPRLVPPLITRCLYLGHCGGMRSDGVGAHLTNHQPDPQADDMLCWPAVVPIWQLMPVLRVG